MAVLRVFFKGDDNLFLSVILLIIGFLVLIKGADVFVDGASNIATNLKVPKMIIALTIVAFGTSAPELSVSVESMLSHNGDIVLGNVIGSNIINILLILGISSFITKLYIEKSVLKKDLPILVIMTLLLSIFLQDTLFGGSFNKITRVDALILFVVFLFFIFLLVKETLKNKDKSKDKPKWGIMKSILITFFGIICVILGSEVVIDSSIEIARVLNISERVISLTVVALGTSLPELVTSTVAALKKEDELAVGNIIGSNIFNIGIVLALPILMFGEVDAIGFQTFDIIILLLSSLILFAFCLIKKNLDRKEGIIMLLVFFIYYGKIIIDVIN